MFNPQAYENSRADGIPVLEIAAGPDAPEPSRGFVPLKRTELKGEVAGPLAALRLLQTFAFNSEQSEKTIEALYRFPLPGDAVVTSVRVRFGGVDIRAEIKERARAEADYDAAKSQGRQAALLTRESPDVFTLQVAGIVPGQDVVVETYYVQLARAEAGGWSLRLPLTTSPRYVRGDEESSRHAQGQPLALLRDLGHRFAIDLRLDGVQAVTSPTHRLSVTAEGERKHVRLEEGDVVPDRDCVLRWTPAQQPNQPALQVWLHDDRATEQVYFLALVTPPATRDPGRGVPREVVLLVDHSGSMEGAKWQAADWTVERFLSDLRERDTFALGLFHNSTHWMTKQLRPASARTVEQAVAFLTTNRDSGGTELGIALEQALGLPRVAGEFARHVLLVTDAEVSDAGRIVRLAEQESQRADRRRISVLCIDAAPNSLLAGELAEQGGGVARFLTSDPQQEDIATALDEVLADWAEPVLASLRLEVNRPTVEAAGRSISKGEEGWSGVDLGDLPAGRPIWVAGRVPRGGSGELAFRVRTARQQNIAAGRTGPAQETRPALKALFGARRVRGLEYLMHSAAAGDELATQLRRLGYDPALVLTAPTASKVYAENTREAVTETLRGLLVREALDYGLPSTETAFVAARSEEGKLIEGTVMVANALPSGWSNAFLGGGGTRIGGAASMLCCLMAAPAAPSAAASGSGGLLRRAASAVRGAFSGKAVVGRARAPGFIGSAEPAQASAKVLFSGVPSFANNEAVLFDSTSSPESGQLPDEATFNRLEVRFPDGTPEVSKLDAGLCLLVFVDDLSAPQARVRLADMVRQRGQRPLNLRRQRGQVVRLVLVDSSGAWKAQAPRLEVALAWQ